MDKKLVAVIKNLPTIEVVKVLDFDEEQQIFTVRCRKLNPLSQRRGPLTTVSISLRFVQFLIDLADQDMVDLEYEFDTTTEEVVDVSGERIVE